MPILIQAPLHILDSEIFFPAFLKNAKRRHYRRFIIMIRMIQQVLRQFPKIFLKISAGFRDQAKHALKRIRFHINHIRFKAKLIRVQEKAFQLPER